MKFGMVYEAPDSCDGIRSAPWNPNELMHVDETLDELSNVLDNARYRSPGQEIYDPGHFFNRRIFAVSDAEREMASHTEAGRGLLDLIDRLDGPSSNLRILSRPKGL